MIVLIVVVFPVPGPPVITKSPQLTASIHRADLQFIQLDLFLFLDDCQTFPNLFFRFGTSDV